ncbi:MAG: gfo/Idh/MocA family oxidoreductase [Acidobacteria bacterium]|nr:MAG: gfo/Idh/MocA family oxidoreductase [Acidobacteriota bacterium]
MTEIDRRRFIVNTAGATAGTALGLSSLGRAAESVNPNGTVRVAVIGVNGRGKDHLHGYGALAARNVEVAAICDVDEDVLRRETDAFEKRFNKRPKAYKELRRVLDDKEIDAVSIATPNHWHSLAAIWACQAGKDVYVEKPLSHNPWEGRKLVEAASRYNRIVQHGTQCRSSQALIEAVQKLREGVIGKVYMAKGLCYKWRNTIGKVDAPQPVPASVDYDLWCGPAPKGPLMRKRLHYDWHWFWSTGNGDIGNQGVHQMDIARWGLGVGLPKRVQSMGDHFMFDDDQETPNTQITAFHYPEEKKLLVFEVRHWMTNPEDIGGLNKEDGNAIGVIFYGSEGYMVIPSYTAYKVFLGRKREPGPAGNQGGDHYLNFIEAMRSRKTEDLHANVTEGHLSAALCHLANIAYRTKRTLEFDPKAERFVADDAANAMLTRDYRKPYVVPNKV